MTVGHSLPPAGEMCLPLIVRWKVLSKARLASERELSIAKNLSNVRSAVADMEIAQVTMSRRDEQNKRAKLISSRLGRHTLLSIIIS